MPFKKAPDLYSIWQGMLGRCRNERHPRWDYYGGRGIKVCERWKTFANFAEDMGPRPAKTSLDRIDNDGDYEPSNCRWATQSQQLRNQRVTRRVIVDGIEHVAADLAEKCGLKTDTIVERASGGLHLDEVLSTKKRVFREGLALGGLANGARQRARTHCAHGHEFTPENTRITPQGWRNCRQCQNAKMRRLSAAKRARLKAAS